MDNCYCFIRVGFCIITESPTILATFYKRGKEKEKKKGNSEFCVKFMFIIYLYPYTQQVFTKLDLDTYIFVNAPCL